jgi:hypothetical protein
MKRCTILLLLAIGTTLGLSRSVRAESEQLSPDDVRRIVAAHAHEVRGCYEKHAMKQRSATGKVLLDLIVRAEGKVAKVEVDPEGVRGRKFQRCVSGKATKWQFPESRHATDVQYPFYFQHSKRG